MPERIVYLIEHLTDLCGGTLGQATVKIAHRQRGYRIGSGPWAPTLAEAAEKYIDRWYIRPPTQWETPQSLIDRLRKCGTTRAEAAEILSGAIAALPEQWPVEVEK